MLINIFTKYKYQLIIALVIFVAIWPVSFYIYLPKWDNIDCYLPYKYFWSDLVWSGEWPLWNPYQYYGLPAYSDMQNGMFNPITWFVVAISGPYTTIASATEFTIYFMIAGFGMWRVSKLFFNHQYIRFILAISFALSGFMIGTSQILIFLMGAAWLPWVLFELIQIFNTPTLKRALLLGSFISLHVTSASPAYSIILIYLVVVYCTYKFFKAKFKLPTTLLYLTIAGAVSIVTALPFILGFYDFQPYFGRLGKLPYTSWIYEGSFDWWEYTSFVVPFITVSDSNIWGPTDLTLRNGYLGIFGLIALIVALIKIKSYRTIKIKLLFLCLLFLILAAGDYTFLYRWFYYLPGFGTFRHPSFFRAYFIFFALLLAGYGFKELFAHPKLIKQTSKLMLFTVVAITVVIFTTQNNIQVSDLALKILQFNSKQPFNIYSFLLINCIVLSLLFIPSLSLYKKPKILVILIVADLLIHAQLFAPHTVANTKVSQTHMKQFFEALPKSINQQPTKTALNQVNENIVSFDNTSIWRNKGTFTKTITPKGHNATQFKNFNVLEENGGLSTVAKNPLFFIGKHTVNQAEQTENQNTIWGVPKLLNTKHNILSQTATILQSKIAANTFEAQIINPSDSTTVLVLNQNFHHNWTATANSTTQKIHKINDGLMCVILPAKFEGEVLFTFNSTLIKAAFYVSLFAWFSIISTLLILWFKKALLFKPSKNTLQP